MTFIKQVLAHLINSSNDPVYVNRSNVESVSGASIINYLKLIGYKGDIYERAQILRSGSTTSSVETDHK